jgi:hypothetical protein
MKMANGTHMGKVPALSAILMGLLASGCLAGHDKGVGESCECNTECSSGSYCADSTGHEIPEDDNGFGGSCTGNGTCVPRGSAGESCDYAVPCSTELRCLTREPRTCELPQAEGASCGDSRDCASGLVCNALRCSVLGGIGDSCGADADCDTSLTCNHSVEPTRCEAPQSLPVDSPCSDDVQCAETLLCHNTGYCTPVGDNGAISYPGVSTCVPRLSVATGQPCHRDDECASARCVETQSGICTLHSCE